MANKYTGKRIFYYDVLRVIAILAIILCHTSRIFGKFTYSSLKLAIPGFCDIIGLVGVPLFFMLSGALLLNRTYDLGEFFKKRFSRILYPAIFWIAITCVLFYFIFTGDSIIKLILGRNIYTWFIWVMIGIYLILPVTNSFVKEYGLRGCEYFLLIWLVTGILKTIGYYPFERLELSYFAGFLGYVVLGYYLANKEFKMHNLVLSVLGFGLFIIFTVMNMMIKYNNLGIESSYLSIFVMFASAGVFLMVRGLAGYLEGKSSKIYEKAKNGTFGDFIFWVSAASYGMYFVNSVVIRFLKLYGPYKLKMLPFLYIFVVVASLAVVVAVSKVPFLKKFSGMS